MTIFDCFPYWRERWAVEARLRLWSGVEDYRPVALLGDRTHRGDPLLLRPVLPPEVWQITVTLDAADDWTREAQQRDEGLRRLCPFMAPDDLLLFCDADELVDPHALPAILAATEAGPVKLKMVAYMCGTRWRHPSPWKHPAACRARDIPANPTADLRLYFGPIPRPMPRVQDAGWHLTYLGTDADVDAKLSAFAHAELDTPEVREDIARIRAEGTDFVDDPLTGPLADILAEVLAVAA